MGCSVARPAKISSETLRWPSVRVKGSRSSKAARIPSGRGRRGTAGELGVGVPAAGEGDLEDERLVPLEAGAGVLDVGLGVRPVDLQQRLGQRDQAAAPRSGSGRGSAASWALGSTVCSALPIFQDSSLAVAG